VLSGNKHYPFELIDEAWKNILLFDEHTWGSWNSISAPHDPFTINQWKTKQSFALAADSITKDIIQRATATVSLNPDKSPVSYDIWNTHSWPVSDMVMIPVPENMGNVYVTDRFDNRLKSQWMSDGMLEVYIRDIPPFSSSKIILKEERNLVHPLMPGKSSYEIVINKESGAVESLRSVESGDELCDLRALHGLNSYVYVAGRDPANKFVAEDPVITYPDRGNLVNSIHIESNAPGTSGLSTDIRIIEPLGRIDIINTVIKDEVYEPEGVHFAFPFNIPDGEVRVNLAWDYYMAGEEQLPGSNFNYNSMCRWVDVSNEEKGILMVSPDAPLIELEEISMDVLSFGEKEGQGPTQTIYSYVMNNYWETNYLAAQPGEATFRYSLYPHEGFDPVFNMKRALERTQPLLVIPSTATKKPHTPIISIDNQEVLVTTIIPGEDKKHFLLRVYNPTSEDQEVRFNWNLLSPINITFSACNLAGENLAPFNGQITIRAHDFQTIRVDY
jgi:hypothetical protein